VTFSDESVTLLNTFTHVLFVKTTSEGEEVVGTGRCARVVYYSRCWGGDGTCRSSRLSTFEACLCSFKFGAQFIVFSAKAAKFDNDFVEEVINLVLVVTFAELRLLKALVYYVFWQ
jgi:hypothetical protein